MKIRNYLDESWSNKYFIFLFLFFFRLFILIEVSFRNNLYRILLLDNDFIFKHHKFLFDWRHI